MRALLFVAATMLWSPAARAEQVALDPANAPRIVHGLGTHDYPTAGALLYSFGAPITANNASSWCSGTLIGCRTFLVAAHCVDDLTPSHYLVYLQHAGLVPVAAIARHPNFVEATFPRFDAAVVTLADWVTGIAPMPINQTDPVPFMPAEGTIVGFGQTQGGGNDYGIKRVGTIETRACPDDLPSGASDDEVVCWSFLDQSGPAGTNSNTCNGDSGGPLLLDLGSGPVVAGITSGGTSGNCLPIDDSYDASVYAHRAFILAQLGTDSTLPCGGLPPVDDPQTTVVGHTGVLDDSHRLDSYLVSVPAGANALRVALNGEDNGSFVVHLFVKQGSGASSSSFDCKADGNAPFGGCSFDLPAAGTWSIAVEQQAGSGVYQLTRTIFGGAPPVCGNDTREFNEVCDGADAELCAGLCASDCTCPTPACGNDVAEQGEQCDGADAASCPGQCAASCECPLVCTQDDLVNISARVTAQRFHIRGRLLTFGGVFAGADPRQGFTLTLTQGSKTVTVDIPANDAGWANSKPARGSYKWKGSRNGITRVTAIDRSARNDTWKVIVGGTAVPGAGGIDMSQPVDVQLTIDQSCTRTVF